MARIQDLLLPSNVEPLGIAHERVQSFTTSASASAAEPTHFTIEYVADLGCPHCYIGLKNLKRAIEVHQSRFPEDTFEITCSPYMLNPTVAKSAYTKPVYYAIRRKTEEHRRGWERHGQEAGINFCWEGLIGNTRDAHKLLRLALEPSPTLVRSSSFVRSSRLSPSSDNGTSLTPSSSLSSAKTASPSTYAVPNHVQDGTPHDNAPTQQPGRGPALQIALLEALFKGSFEDGRDVSDNVFLLETALKVTKFPIQEIQACLEDDEHWGSAINALCLDTKARVTAVPTCIVQGRKLVGGWQQPELFADVFAQVKSPAS